MQDLSQYKVPRQDAHAAWVREKIDQGSVTPREVLKMAYGDSLPIEANPPYDNLDEPIPLCWGDPDPSDPHALASVILRNSTGKFPLYSPLSPVKITFSEKFKGQDVINQGMVEQSLSSNLIHEVTHVLHFYMPVIHQDSEGVGDFTTASVGDQNRKFMAKCLQAAPNPPDKLPFYDFSQTEAFARLAQITSHVSELSKCIPTTRLEFSTALAAVGIIPGQEEMKKILFSEEGRQATAQFGYAHVFKDAFEQCGHSGPIQHPETATMDFVSAFNKVTADVPDEQMDRLRAKQADVMWANYQSLRKLQGKDEDPDFAAVRKFTWHLRKATGNEPVEHWQELSAGLDPHYVFQLYQLAEIRDLPNASEALNQNYGEIIATYNRNLTPAEIEFQKQRVELNREFVKHERREPREPITASVGLSFHDITLDPQSKSIGRPLHKS